MAASRDLVVRFRGDADQLNKTIGGVEKQARGIGGEVEKGGKRGQKGMAILGGGVRALTRLFGPLLAAASAFSAIDFAKGAIEKASELEQSSGAIEAVFKKDAKTIRESAKRASSDLGLTQNAYQELATVLGAGLKNKGIEDFTGQTQDLIGLGADLAAMYGGTAQDAVSALSSLMRGESDPIEKYGVAINETAIQAELAAKGQDKLKGAALEQAKAQARLTVLFRQTKDAQGAAGREAGTFASQQQKLTAKWEEFQASVGEKFLPIVTNVVTALNEKLMPALSQASEWVTGLFAGAAEMPPWLAGIQEWAQGVAKDFEPVAESWRNAMSAFSAPADGGIVTWWEENLQPALQSLMGAYAEAEATVRPIITEIATLLGDLLAEHAPEIEAASKAIGEVVTSLMGLLEAVIGAATRRISKIWNDWGWLIKLGIEVVFDRVVKIVKAAMKILGGIIDVATGIISGDWDKVWNGARKMVQGSWDLIVGLVTGGTKAVVNLLAKWGVIDWFARIIGGVRDNWSRFRELVVGPVRSAREAVGRVLNSMGRAFRLSMNVISDQLGRLREAAKKPVNFVINTVYNDGLRAAFNKIAETFGADVRLPRIAGFARGGWTGPGARHDVAGVVHADEFVVNKRSRGQFERKFPGYLKHINDEGTLPGYADGGRVYQPVPGRGNRHSGYGWATWAGDFPVSMGTPIAAWKDGSVSAVNRWNYSYGKHIRMNHTDGTSSLYAHLSKILVRLGQQIGGGQTIGLVGSTGNSTGPHLHFETMGGPYSGGQPGSGKTLPSISPGALLDKLLHGPLDKLGGIGSSPMAQLAAAWPRFVAGKAKDMLLDQLGFGGAGGDLPVLDRDRGGPLPVGPSIVRNNTGGQEWVSTGEQMDRMLTLLEQRSDEPMIQINGNVGGTPVEVVAELKKQRRRREALRARV